MSNTAALRASSLLVSAGLLGGVVLLALTFTYVVSSPSIIDRMQPVTVEREPPPSPPIVRPQPPRPIEPIVTPEGPVADPLPRIEELPPQPFAGPTVVADPAPTITNPRWLRRPRDLQRYYPRRALQAGVEGFVLLDCSVAVTGMLNCAVVSETPTNWGFAEAALRIAADHRMEPAMSDGSPVEGRYRMRVPFRAQ